MCGRYDLSETPARLREVFSLESVPMFAASHDIRPTQLEPVIRQKSEGGREALLMRWGLVPGWAKDIKVGGLSTFNARAEGIATSGTFRHAYRHQRCLVPASAFYEWQAVGSGKIKYRIGLLDTDLFAFAGLWEVWHDPRGQTIQSFAIITTRANALIAPIHAKQRMPVILAPETYSQWLDPEGADSVPLWEPYPAERMYAVPAGVPAP